MILASPATMLKQPYLIGIAGPSCSGKSEISSRLAKSLGASLLSLDSYYRDLSHLAMADREKVNFDSPESMNEELLIEQLTQLASGIPIDKPTYDFARHTPSDRLERIQPSEYVVVEGLFTLYWPQVRTLLRASVFIAASHQVCLERRMERDVRDRGRTPDYITAQYDKTVRPMCDRYILPTERYADLVLTGTNYLDQSVQCIIALIRANLGSRNTTGLSVASSFS